jgi:hypothetical protein
VALQKAPPSFGDPPGLGVVELPPPHDAVWHVVKVGRLPVESASSSAARRDVDRSRAAWLHNMAPRDACSTTWSDAIHATAARPWSTDLAHSWEIAKDGTTYTFHLCQGGVPRLD